MDDFFSKALEDKDVISIDALKPLIDFLEKEKIFEESESYDSMRFVGYALDIGFSNAKIITSDPFKRAVGGVPRGSFLIMVPQNFEKMQSHFTLLRVEDVTPTPLTGQVQQTYFELHKKSMPELDVWTQSELQWGALNTKVVGMFYPNQKDKSKISFSGDMNSISSAHRYRVYSPNDTILDLIVNSIVNKDGQENIGKLRLTECELPFYKKELSDVDVRISIEDFKGFRTAMFGKTRLGKSNVVKLIAQSIIDQTRESRTVGQVIFDINGEYANDNHQNKSLKSVNPNECEVYALTKRPTTASKSLKFNFYEQPDACLKILSSLLENDNQSSQYIKSFCAVELPSIKSIASMSPGDKLRATRKIKMFWAVLSVAGFMGDGCHKTLGNGAVLDPGFSKELRKSIWGEDLKNISNLHDLAQEFIKIIEFHKVNPNDKIFTTSSGKPLFDADDWAILHFLKPANGGGPMVIRPYIKYHDSAAGNFVHEILGDLDKGKTIILDLGNADENIRKYFSDHLSRAIFSHQEKKFTSDSLKNHYIQIYFEEAHNLFPKDGGEVTDVYSRFAKEGAKFHIGMVYSTQSPSTINQELLIQTENFFVGHLSSVDETKSLSRHQAAFLGIEEDILRSRTPGYMRMLTFSHRFVIPVQTHKFEVLAEKKNK